MRTPSKMTNNENKPGPKPKHVKIEGDWEDAVKKALEKERPEEGWPKDDEKPHPNADSGQVEDD